MHTDCSSVFLFHSLMINRYNCMLCRLFSMFDDLATLHGVQKVETAGAVQ